MAERNDPLREPALPRLGLSTDRPLRHCTRRRARHPRSVLPRHRLRQRLQPLPHCHVGRQPQRITGHRTAHPDGREVGTTTAAPPPIPRRRHPRRLDHLLHAGRRCSHTAPERAGSLEPPLPGGNTRRGGGARRPGGCGRAAVDELMTAYSVATAGPVGRTTPPLSASLCWLRPPERSAPYCAR